MSAEALFVSRLFPEGRRVSGELFASISVSKPHSFASDRSFAAWRFEHNCHAPAAARRASEARFKAGKGEVASTGAYQCLKIERLAILALADRFQSFPAPPGAAHVDAPSRGVRDPYCLNRRHGNKIRTPMIACQPLCDPIRRPSFAQCAISTALLPRLRP
jgi:hypothetical protein